MDKERITSFNELAFDTKARLVTQFGHFIVHNALPEPNDHIVVTLYHMEGEYVMVLYDRAKVKIVEIEMPDWEDMDLVLERIHIDPITLKIELI